MSFNPHTLEYRAEMERKFNLATLRPECAVEVARLAQAIVKFRAIYEPVEKATGVPWWLVGCFDLRECAFRHDLNLCNGDPLIRPTVNVPKGMGPFRTWTEGAIFAMHYSKLEARDDVGWMIEAERYNGEGYHNHTDPAAPSIPEPSPYLWASTSVYTSGKYESDGNWNPDLVDKQAGVVAIMLALDMAD